MADELLEKFLNRSEFQRALDAMPVPDCEPLIGKKLKEDGWVYGDLPRMSRENVEKFIEIAGKENLQWLTFATYQSGANVRARGQYFISPQGAARLRLWVRENTQ
jgi:hypothetical protein